MVLQEMVGGGYHKSVNQMEIALAVHHKAPEIAQGSKTDLGRRLALLLRK